jgi:hypothetical protein
MKYENIEDMGLVFAEELFSDINDENLRSNELLYRKIAKKLSEAYNFGITESQAELQEAMDAISSLKINKI